MMKSRSSGLIFLAAFLLSCGGVQINLDPLLQEFAQYELETGDLNPTTQAGEALQAARAKREQAQTLLGKGRGEAARAILEKAVADIRVAWAIGRAYDADRRTDPCRQMVERNRYQWENARLALEEAERAAGRSATDVPREVPSEEETKGAPLPPPVISGSKPVAGDWMSLTDAWNVWAEVARDRGVGIADLASRFEAQIAASTDKETKDELRPLQLYLAGRTIQELEARVRAAAADQLCIRSILLAERLREASERAYQATLELQKGLAEDLKAEVISREDEMYAALRQLEGKYARIRKEARGTIVSLADILFDFDKATLKRDVEFNLVKIATILNQFPEMKILVEGHTDNIGTPEYNLELSKQRAQAVFDFLVSMGVAVERMTAEGYGLTRPVADNGTEEGRQRNRRVDLVIREEEG